MIKNKDYLDKLRKAIAREREIIREMSAIANKEKDISTREERKMAFVQMNQLKDQLKMTHFKISKMLDLLKISPLLREELKTRLLPIKEKKVRREEKPVKFKPYKLKVKLSELELETLKRLKTKKEERKKKKVKRLSTYTKISNRIFSEISLKLIKKGYFRNLEKDLLKANLHLFPTSYVSLIFFTSSLSIITAIILFVFFLFFNVGPVMPILTLSTESIAERFIKVFWVLFVIPISTFLIMYFYPSMEKKSIENKINQELPFATIHMAAISSSMVEPSKIFSIVMMTEEYPYLTKEFTKLINEINVYGYNLVGALRHSAMNSPSQKLADLFNGLATTITSGGNLSEFFEKRAETLLFDYRIEREKYTKTAETFMDIYISVVIAAPMILMLLLMMMKISRLGIMLSTSMISLMMVLGVSLINVLFLTFLHLKQPSK